MRKISIIIPCYKDAATLNIAIKSVYAQTRKVDEVIIVNDNSPESDKIESIVKNYPSVVYIKNEKNVGLAASRNVGLSIASGELITFLDADDELHPQKIEFQLSVYRSDISVACQFRNIENSNTSAEIQLFEKRFKTKKVTNPSRLIWRNNLTLTGASIMISRELLLSVDGYDENLRSCEDWDLWLRLLHNGVIAYSIQLPLYLYRYNESGLSTNYTQISYWDLEVLKKYFSRQGNDFLKSSKDARLWSFYLVRHMMRFEKNLAPDLRLAIQQNIKLLSSHPFLMRVLSVIEKLRVLRFFVFLVR